MPLGRQTIRRERERLIPSRTSPVRAQYPRSNISDAYIAADSRYAHEKSAAPVVEESTKNPSRRHARWYVRNKVIGVGMRLAATFSWMSATERRTKGIIFSSSSLPPAVFQSFLPCLNLHFIPLPFERRLPSYLNIDAPYTKTISSGCFTFFASLIEFLRISAYAPEISPERKEKKQRDVKIIRSDMRKLCVHFMPFSQEHSVFSIISIFIRGREG